ncbi:hypothetical protein VP1G_01409 [Cytospora mali]|uniref:Methyltransferase type 11 domain-containing protein n=1 Tax=Cytospora mali TaxID=578113 RepID=A0A194UQY4_CYTMA|nr:hypothetical protein VP1G_01409 [Valsa mali var. pyri (nom. inval.)]
MAELVILPQTTTGLEPPPQGRRRPRALNTIMEEENEDVVSPVRSPFLRKKIARERTQDKDRVQAWLAPLDPILSEEVPTPKGFPTPRGFHFMTAPTLPSSPSSASASGEEGSSQGSSSRTNSWNRQSVMTDVTEFDDLYGVSEDESEQSADNGRQNAPTVPPKTPFDQARKALPQLVIPEEQQPNASKSSPRHQGLKKTLASPVPPTPPSAVIMSPAMLVYMQAQHAHPIPAISAPPSLDGSLDGSLTSEQLAAMSAPPTPVMSSEDPDDSGDAWTGVQLQPGALATLQALSGHGSEEFEQHREEGVINVPEIPMTESRSSPPRLITNNLRRNSIMLSPAQQRTLGNLTKLDIPSPGGFFSGLSPRTRTTWHLGTSPADDIAPPTSTTAEQFYRVPWNMNDAPSMPAPPMPIERPLHMAHGTFSSSPVEHVVEMLEPIKEEDTSTARRVEEPVTAKRIPTYQPSTVSEGDDEEFGLPSSPKEEDHVAEIVVDYDPNYARKQQEIAVSHLDRTEVWLRAQFSYMRGVGFEAGEQDIETELEKARVKKTEETEATSPELDQPPTPPPKAPLPQPSTAVVPAAGKKKSVRFSAQPIIAPAAGDIPLSLPSKLLRQESAYYRAFQSMTVRATPADVFVHRLPRFEALQAERVSLREQHRDHLLGKYQLAVVPQSAKKRMSANVARGDDEIFEDLEKMRLDKEADALKQMCTANWYVAALKMLNGGKLVCAPVHKRLARLSLAPQARGQNRLRILDLGGQGACDWAWHAALQYPNAKIYTVTTKAIRQLSNSNIRGPPNHRQVAVNNLCHLPFADDQFDLVSARELHSILRVSDVPDTEDEWDLCLREIMRVLKPGGYIEYNVMDSDIVNAGPLGLAKSVEFGFTLKTLGCDPSPTKSFLPRLYREGFEDVRRAWTVLPLGPKPIEKPGPIRYGPNGPEPSPPAGGKLVSLDAMAPGSLPGSTDDAAAIAGIAGTWSWERWLMRCEMEKANGELRSGFKLADTVSTDGGVMREAEKSLRGVHAVIEEGRGCGAALRVLKGFARKPEATRSITQEVLDVLDSMDVMDF